MKKKVLITGSKGQLGKKIIDLMARDFDLILTDSDNMNITNKDLVDKFFKQCKPDWVIHTAAYTQVDKAEDFPEICQKVNVYGTKNIALASQEIDAKLIYISTDYVFDGRKKSPYIETDKPSPLSVYGHSKYCGETEIEQICDQYYILRSSWIFGELPKNHPGTNFVETMLRLASEKKELRVVKDQIGSPTYTKDLVQIIIRIVNLCPNIGIYNFSGQGMCSWYDFAKEIFSQKNINIDLNPITSDQFPQKAKRPSYSYLDKTKLETLLRIKVRSWQEMLSEYLELNH
jgi:dTDP-4-dehydrorhamnose reductase